jgi:hypothetical protein
MKFEDYRSMVLTESLNDQINEMARIGPQHHGIPNVVIYAGETNKRHGLRVKISKFKNKWVKGDENNFIIQMPSLDYDPQDVPRWIDENTMAKILGWIKLNQQQLHDFEIGKIMYADDFYAKISKY